MDYIWTVPLRGSPAEPWCNTTVIGDQAQVIETRLLRVLVGGQQIQHQFWLANIQDPCIIGLNLLDKWGAVVYLFKIFISFKSKISLQIKTEERNK